jgi:hypothetical protein
LSANSEGYVTDISFDREIADLEAELAAERQELARLQEQWDAFDGDFAELREALTKLRAAAEGRTPRGEAARSPLEIELNPETGRPPRGARREQIVAICRRIGRGGKTFRTVDVLDVIGEVDGEVSSGVRSYTYAIMKTFAEEGFLEKVDRGTWKLA